MELRGKFYECFDLQRRGFFEDGNATSIPASTDKAKEEKEKETK
jgi:hypothetical protein